MCTKIYALKYVHLNVELAKSTHILVRILSAYILLHSHIRVHFLGSKMTRYARSKFHVN